MTVLTSPTSVAGSASQARQVPVLTVTHGLHQGGRITLDGAVYTLGSTSDADFILNDAGIAPNHLVLRVVDGWIAVEARGGDVRVENRQGQQIQVPAGSGYRGQMPMWVSLGEARLSLGLDPATRAPAAAAASRFARPHLLLALGLMGICAFAFAFRDEPAKPIAAVLAPAAPVAKAPTIEQARLWLDQQVQEAGLGAVKISEAGGQLLAEGQADLAQKTRWLALRQQFDQRFGQQVMLHSTVTTRADVAKPRVRFQAVFFGDNPYVIGDGGKRLYPGSAVGDGWTLERIAQDQVVLARGDERFTLTL